MKYSHEYKDWFLPQRVFPSKQREDKTMRDVIQIFIHGSTQTTSSPSPQSVRLWAKSRQTALRTKEPSHSDHSFQKEVRTSAEGRDHVESSRQSEATSTGPEVIDTPGAGAETSGGPVDTCRRNASVLQSSIRNNHPHSIWLCRPQASEERPPSFPSSHWSFTIPHFFPSFWGWCRNRGTMLDDFRIETLH
jgi:hypothetical protein